MTNPEKVMEGVARALKKGGRFVAETGRKGNVEKIENAIFETVEKHNLKAKKCWFFPTPEEKTELLEKYGLKEGIEPKKYTEDGLFEKIITTLK